MEAMAISNSPGHKPIGTGGFLDPQSITEQFEIKDGMKVADFGSGGGYFTIYLAEKVGSSGRIYALDILEEKLDNLRAKARAVGLENIETIRTNLEVVGSSSLLDSSQDVVLMANVLFQSTKRSNILAEASRILKKQGELIIIDWKKGSGGFGPPDSFRLSDSEIKSIVEKLKFSLVRQINSGDFHFGFIFKKE